MTNLLRSAVSALALLSLTAGPSFAGSSTATLAVTISAPSIVTNTNNTITVSDASGTVSTNYPIQFGRPFIQGVIPHAPQVLANGVALASQADIKNRYPDKSVAYAVISVVLPTIPANGSVILSFQDTTTNINTPLTTAQMLDDGYNFDAIMTLAGAPTDASLHGVKDTVPNDGTIAGWQAITNGAFDISIDGVVQHVTGFNFSSLASDWSNFVTLLQAPLTPFGITATRNTDATFTLSLAPGAHTLSFATPPTTGGTDESAAFGFAASENGTLQAGISSGTPQTASALTMLKNNDYTLWTSGPVAQTIILGDDSPSRKYDLGFGDGYHPFRPHFIATFWTQTHQVFVRAIGENGLTTELEDIGPYNLTITGGSLNGTTEETFNNLSQGAMQTWNKSFWIGGAPQVKINIDNNLAYLESTRFIPNYDPSIILNENTIAGDYSAWWTVPGHDISQAGGWTPGMPTSGARADIGPEPSWDAAWLYTGDWRLRQTALGNADLASWWPVNTRETGATERLLTSDPAPVPPAVGTGYGHPISITDRVDLGPAAGGEGDFLYYNSGISWAPNTLTVVGPLNASNPNGWTFDVAHEPSPFFIPYILTGDPFYLEELENWAAYDAATNQGAAARGLNQGRGPTGAEGGLYDQLRGDGWGLKSRAEAAFAEPDGTPEKTWLTEETNSDIARWEGALGVPDPVFAGSPEYVWAQQTGDPESRSGNSPPPPLGNWEDSLNVGLDGGGQYRPGLVDRGSTNQWMQWYVQYAIGRIHELGFQDEPLVLHSGAYLTNEINISGYPELIADYNIPTSFTVGGLIPDWPTMIADLNPAYLTGAGWAASCGSDCTTQGPLPVFFQRQLYSQGYDAYVMAALSPLVDAGAPGATQAEAWVKANIHDPLAANGALQDPSWAIVPHTDNNALPPQPVQIP